MEKKIIIAVFICLTWYHCSSLGQTLQTSRSWRRAFQADVEIAGHFVAYKTASEMSCGRFCQDPVNCLSFGWNADYGSCWLYDHLAVYRLTGPPAPGTLYSWPLAPRCPTDRNYTLQSGVCYNVYPDLRNWTDAARVCTNDGGHLFVADTLEKLQLLKVANRYLMLGATDAEIEGEWVWADGSRLTRTSPLWAPNQPDGGVRSNYMGCFPRGKLDDYTNNSLNMFACQIPTL